MSFAIGWLNNLQILGDCDSCGEPQLMDEGRLYKTPAGYLCAACAETSPVTEPSSPAGRQI